MRSDILAIDAFSKRYFSATFVVGQHLEVADLVDARPRATGAFDGEVGNIRDTQPPIENRDKQESPQYHYVVASNAHAKIVKRQIDRRDRG